jgi:hypothetical protein
MRDKASASNTMDDYTKPPHRTKSTIATKIGLHVGGALIATVLIAGASDKYLGSSFSGAVSNTASNATATIKHAAKPLLQHLTR